MELMNQHHHHHGYEQNNLFQSHQRHPGSSSSSDLSSSLNRGGGRVEAGWTQNHPHASSSASSSSQHRFQSQQQPSLHYHNEQNYATTSSPSSSVPSLPPRSASCSYLPSASSLASSSTASTGPSANSNRMSQSSTSAHTLPSPSLTSSVNDNNSPRLSIDSFKCENVWIHSEHQELSLRYTKAVEELATARSDIIRLTADLASASARLQASPLPPSAPPSPPNSHYHLPPRSSTYQHNHYISNPLNHPSTGTPPNHSNTDQPMLLSNHSRGNSYSGPPPLTTISTSSSTNSFTSSFPASLPHSGATTPTSTTPFAALKAATASMGISQSHCSTPTRGAPAQIQTQQQHRNSSTLTSPISLNGHQTPQGTSSRSPSAMERSTGGRPKHYTASSLQSQPPDPMIVNQYLAELANWVRPSFAPHELIHVSNYSNDAAVKRNLRIEMVNLNGVCPNPTEWKLWIQDRFNVVRDLLDPGRSWNKQREEDKQIAIQVIEKRWPALALCEADKCWKASIFLQRRLDEVIKVAHEVEKKRTTSASPMTVVSTPISERGAMTWDPMERWDAG